MPEDPGAAADCHERYFSARGKRLDEFKRRYPETYVAFMALSCDEVEVLNKIGKALEDQPDVPSGGEDYAEDDVSEDAAPNPAAKLAKYLYVIH
jgi:hypothetical protein